MMLQCSELCAVFRKNDALPRPLASQSNQYFCAGTGSIVKKVLEFFDGLYDLEIDTSKLRDH